MAKTPTFLKKGDCIGIVAPARKISRQELLPALDIFKEWGLEVVLGNALFNSFHQFSGTDSTRIKDFQYMLDNSEIKAIFCARGGYGTVRIIDSLCFDTFMLNPKWIVGFSDITVLHAHVNKLCGVETLHALMPFNLAHADYTKMALNSLKNTLFGKPLQYTIKAHNLNRKGKAKGVLLGGNLSVLYSLSGSTSDINTAGKILFIEDLDEYLYHIDRMMMWLKRAGKLNKLKALIVGAMSKMNDNTIPFGKKPYEIIADAVKEYNYPICFNFPSGHIRDNKTLILGRTVELCVGDESTLNFL